jgi:hypothetical protein
LEYRLDSRTFALLWQTTSSFPFGILGSVVEVNPYNGEFTLGEVHNIHQPEVCTDCDTLVLGVDSFQCAYQHNQQILCACTYFVIGDPISTAFVIKVIADTILICCELSFIKYLSRWKDSNLLEYLIRNLFPYLLKLQLFE